MICWKFYFIYFCELWCVKRDLLFYKKCHCLPSESCTIRNQGKLNLKNFLHSNIKSATQANKQLAGFNMKLVPSADSIV